MSASRRRPPAAYVLWWLTSVLVVALLFYASARWLDKSASAAGDTVPFAGLWAVFWGLFVLGRYRGDAPVE